MVSCTTSPDFDWGVQGGMYTPEPSSIYGRLFMTLEDFQEGVNAGAFGPDEDCRWVYITLGGHLSEEPIKHPRLPRPARTIAVIYYAT